MVRKTTARQTPKKAVAKRTTSIEMADWEKQMQQDAEIAANMESRIGSANFFATSGGVLKFNDTEIPNNQMAVIIADYIIEKTWYSDEYDPDNPVPPGCFSFTRGDELEMVPHEKSDDSQSEQCDGCEWNEFGSADRGKGKACRDHRRLALLSAGVQLDNGEWDIKDDPAWFKEEEFGFLRIPPTSLKAWAKYVKQLKGALNRPPYGVVTLIKMIPDTKNQFTFTFQALCNIPDTIGAVIMERHRQALEPEVVDFPYLPASENDEEKSKVKRSSSTTKKTAARKNTTKKTTARRNRKY